jgi:hypothetical protein
MAKTKEKVAKAAPAAVIVLRGYDIYGAKILLRNIEMALEGLHPNYGGALALIDHPEVNVRQLKNLTDALQKLVNAAEIKEQDNAVNLTGISARNFAVIVRQAKASLNSPNGIVSLLRGSGVIGNVDHLGPFKSIISHLDIR